MSRSPDGPGWSSFPINENSGDRDAFPISTIKSERTNNISREKARLAFVPVGN